MRIRPTQPGTRIRGAERAPNWFELAHTDEESERPSLGLGAPRRLFAPDGLRRVLSRLQCHGDPQRRQTLALRLDRPCSDAFPEGGRRALPKFHRHEMPTGLPAPL